MQSALIIPIACFQHKKTSKNVHNSSPSTQVPYLAKRSAPKREYVALTDPSVDGDRKNMQR